MLRVWKPRKQGNNIMFEDTSIIIILIIIHIEKKQIP